MDGASHYWTVLWHQLTTLDTYEEGTSETKPMVKLDLIPFRRPDGTASRRSNKKPWNDGPNRGGGGEKRQTKPPVKSHMESENVSFEQNISFPMHSFHELHFSVSKSKTGNQEIMI